MDENQSVWIKGAELQSAMELPYSLTPALGTIKSDHSKCRKEGGGAAFIAR
jgi:hypothetical protein